MSDATFVVMPIRADGPPPQRAQQHDPNEVATAIEKSLNEKLHPEEHQEPEPEPPEDGPLKKAIAHSDSLYKYISWEDPVRTLASYFGLLGLLFGLHYLRFTQLLLKLSATGLGLVSFTSLVSHSTKNDFISRMRPEYKEVPESTLNATLKDIHDLVQYLAIQAQKIMYGEDTGKTFGAFISVTTLFWLIKVLSPFNLEILGLSSAFIVPLLFSPGGRDLAQNAKFRAQELAQTTAESTGVVIRDGQAKAADISRKAQEGAGSVASRTQHTASNMSSDAQQAAGNLMSKTQQTVSDLSSNTQQVAGIATAQTQETVSNLASETSRFAGVLSSKTKQTATNLPSKIPSVTRNRSTGGGQTAVDTQPRTGNVIESSSLPGAQQQQHVYHHHVKKGNE